MELDSPPKVNIEKEKSSQGSFLDVNKWKPRSSPSPPQKQSQQQPRPTPSRLSQQPRPRPNSKAAVSRVEDSKSAIVLKPDIGKYPLTYMAANKYKGPVVEGWPPQRNRSIPLYIRPKKDTFPWRPTSEAVRNCQLLIIVHTRPDFFEARIGVRNTYGQYIQKGLGGNTAILFLIGNLNWANTTKYNLTLNKLRKEQEFFGDILQV